MERIKCWLKSMQLFPNESEVPKKLTLHSFFLSLCFTTIFIVFLSLIIVASTVYVDSIIKTAGAQEFLNPDPRVKKPSINKANVKKGNQPLSDLGLTSPKSKYKGFWNTGSAKSPFLPSGELFTIDNPQMIRELEQRQDDEEEELEDDEASEKEDLNKDTDPNLAAMNKEQFNQYMANKYSSPDADLPVEAREKAPPGFKAMLEAMNYGHTDIAMQYALQHVKYKAKKNRLIRDLTNMQVKAMELEGLRPVRKTSEQPIYSEIDKIYEEKLKEKQEAKSQTHVGTSTTVLNNNVRQLLDFGQENESELLFKSRISDDFQEKFLEKQRYLNDFTDTEKQIRKRVRREREGTIQPDPKGQARLYFFFNKYDQDSVAMMPVVEKLFTKRLMDKNFSVTAFSTRRLMGGEIGNFSKMVSFTVRDGADLAEKMGITNTPTFVILSPNSNTAIFEKGIRATEFLDELINIVQGRKLQKKFRGE